ncbi:MAG: JAB domain-containing protein [Geminicoccaceae bacterium]
MATIGLEIDTDREPGGGENYVVRGDTFRHKETIKAHGGRWSKSRRAWVFHDRSAIERLSAVFSSGTDSTAAPGFAEAPLPFRQPGEVQSTRPSQGPQPASDKPAVPVRPHFHGHRDRLRERFLESDGEDMPDYELLELLLFSSIRYVDVKPLAKHLLNKIGSVGGILAADRELLKQIMLEKASVQSGKSKTPANHAERMRDDPNYANCIRDGVDFTFINVKNTQRLQLRALIEDLKAQPVVSSWQALLDYLKLALGHEPIEQFRVLFLDKKNILRRDEVQQRGTVDHTPLYPREIAKRALELNASALIMVHNHPSGDPTPSRADIEMTKQVEAALAPIRVALHDHLIIGKDRHLSFKSEGLI